MLARGLNEHLESFFSENIKESLFVILSHKEDMPALMFTTTMIHKIEEAIVQMKVTHMNSGSIGTPFRTGDSPYGTVVEMNND